MLQKPTANAKSMKTYSDGRFVAGDDFLVEQQPYMALWRNLVETHHTQNVEGVILVLVRIRLELQIYLRGGTADTLH